MPLDVNVPELGESITEVQVSAWLKQPGEAVALDEPIIELESDKATVEVPAPAAGVLTEILVDVGGEARVGDLLARIDTEGKESEPSAESAPAQDADGARDEAPASEDGEARVMPAAQRVMDEKGLAAGDVKGSGPGGRVLKEDAERAAAGRSEAKQSGAGKSGDDKSGEDKSGEDKSGDGKSGDDKPGEDRSAPAKSAAPRQAQPGHTAPPMPAPGSRGERTEKMSPIRRRIAERLVQSQHTAALLTTFNEIDMTRVKELRALHQEAFQQKHGVKLGFMSFFAKAAVEALQLIPALNAQIRDDHIVYHDYCDIGIAVGGGKGLVVPVIRNAEARDFGGLERIIADFGARAQANKIDLDELSGGTFTISNGGVYGSLMSTPIINPPQSGVLGLHAIQDRPVVVDGQVVVRPMMYVALTYDHRLVDGREAVTFLKHIKLCVEQPERLLLKV